MSSPSDINCYAWWRSNQIRIMQHISSSLPSHWLNQGEKKKRDVASWVVPNPSTILMFSFLLPESRWHRLRWSRLAWLLLLLELGTIICWGVKKVSTHTFYDENPNNFNLFAQLYCWSNCWWLQGLLEQDSLKIISSSLHQTRLKMLESCKQMMTWWNSSD